MVDAIIRLFEDDETVFDSNGIGYLSDATFCKVTEERNGSFELKMKYPIKGVRYSELKMRRIIVAKPNPYANAQPFRIYSISKPISGIVTVNAEHISYDMSGFPVIPFEASSVSSALTGLKNHSSVPCPFDFWTDKTTDGNFKIVTPSNMRNCLGGTEGSILDVFGTGEYEFDRYDVKFYLHRGMDRGVTLRYGKNITDLQQEENNANVYTGVYPYWYSEEDGLVTSEPQIINGPGTYNYQRIYILDLSYDWVEKPTPEDLKEAAEKYVENNNIGVPKISIDVSFIHLADSDEYSDLKNLETVHLCDTVTVIFDDLGVNATSKCVKTIYDCLIDKYDSISLGDSKTNLADTIAENKISTDDKIENQKSFLEKAVGSATAMITGNMGGYVVLHSSTGERKPDELLIMDSEDIDTAQHVWRWNNSGLGYSNTGYNGPYGTAITADGRIVADFVTTGEMLANRIRGGTLSMGGIDNAGGTIQVLNANNEIDAQLDNSGFKMHKNPIIIYGLQPIDSGNTLPISTSYAGNYMNLIVNGAEIFRQGLTGGASQSALNYALMAGKTMRALLFGATNENNKLSPFFYINNGSNMLGYEEPVVFFRDCRFVYFIYLGSSNIRLYGAALSGSNYMVVSNGGIYAEGNIMCSGDKHRLVETEHYGSRLLNAMESPEPRFFDFGSCTVGYNGVVKCNIEPIFLETIESEEDYQVFLTRTNASHSSDKEFWVEKFKGYFVVHGSSGAKYDYMISAIQKDRKGVRLKIADELLKSFKEDNENGNRDVYTIDL